MSKHCPERFKSTLCHEAGEKKKKRKKKRKPPNHQCWDHLEWSNPCFKSLCSPVPLQCWRVLAECYLLDCWSVRWLLRLISKIPLWRLCWEAAFFKLGICSRFGWELPYCEAFSMARTENPSPRLQGMLCYIKLVPWFLGEKALVFQVFKISCMGFFFVWFFLGGGRVRLRKSSGKESCALS